MNVQELLTRLSNSELSNISIGNEGSGTIKPEAIPKIVGHMNDALLKLYSRFILSENTLIIEQVDELTRYPLEKKYAVNSGSSEPIKWIVDTIDDPFKGDVIKILEIYDIYGTRRVLNDTDAEFSFFTPQPNVLQVPYPEPAVKFMVNYQARHAPLISTGESYLDQIIVLPFFLETAMQSYIASKVYRNMNGQENMATSKGYMEEYEFACMEIENKDLVNNTWSTTHTKLEQRGFV